MAVTYLTLLLALCNVYILCPDTKNNNGGLKFASPCIINQFKQINQLDAAVSHVYYLTFMYSSTYFGRPHAHH